MLDATGLLRGSAVTCNILAQPLDIFLYSYEAEFIYSPCSRPVRSGWYLSSTSHMDTSMTFCPLIIQTLRIISVRCIPLNLRSKTRRRANTSASYLDLLLSIGRDGQLHTSLYDKRDYFNFHITNFPFLSSNIPSSPAYGVLYLTTYPIRQGLLLL